MWYSGYMTTETIRDRNNKIIGTIETSDNGDAVARRFSGPKVGTYTNSTNQVNEFGGPCIGYGKGLLYGLLSD
jgi:hypothetical protein